MPEYLIPGLCLLSGYCDIDIWAEFVVLIHSYAKLVVVLLITQILNEVYGGHVSVRSSCLRRFHVLSLGTRRTLLPLDPRCHDRLNEVEMGFGVGEFLDPYDL